MKKVFTLISTIGIIVYPTIIFLLTASQIVAQNVKPKVFVEFNNESEGWINSYLEETNKWAIVGSPTESNVIFRVQMSEGAARAFGKIFIIDSETEQTLYTTENLKGQSSAFNGYAPKKNLAKKLIADIDTKFDKRLININHFGRNKVSTDNVKQPNISNDSKYDKLLKLKKLLDDGAINQAEYDEEKKKILKDS